MSQATKSQAPRKNPWIQAGIAMAVLVTALFIAVLTAKGLRSLPAVQEFLVSYPGQAPLPEGAPIGLPAWLGWQHFLNAFFLVLIIRSGWMVRTTTRPRAYWTRKNEGPLRTKGKPNKISLELWLHLSLDALWVLNGLTFILLLFLSGQWKRVVPVNWDIVPNAISALLQYASLQWPHENGWVNYNALQMLAYCVTIFVAAPLAILTGARMSAAWPKSLTRINRLYPVEVARALHYPVMLYFVLFVIAHVTLVFATGALRNLNHMYAARDDGGWTGFWYFSGSLLMMIAACFLARTLFLRPIAALTGSVTRT